MQKLGANFVTAKLSGVLAIFFTVIISWKWFKNTIGAKAAFLLLGLEIWMLFHWHHIYFIRPDSMLLLCTTVSMYVTTMLKNPIAHILGLAIPLAMVINLKIHGLLYYIPIFAIAYQHVKVRQLTFACGMGIILSFLPYMLPQVSLKNYLAFILNSFDQGFSLANFSPKIALLAILLLLPICFAKINNISLKEFYFKNKPLLLALFLPVVMVSVIVSKGGSGTNHIMPFLPVFFHFYLQIILIKQNFQVKSLLSFKELFRPAGALMCLLLLIITVSGFTTQNRIWEQMKRKNHTAILQDLRQIQNHYSNKTIEVGYGEDKSYEAYRDMIAVPVFSGNPLYVEVVAMWDMQMSGVGIPNMTLQSLKGGGIQVWLIPKGNKPFDIKGHRDKLFSGAFQETFMENYKLAASSAYFDIWVHKSVHSNQI